jgi:hypothetical protein
MSHGDTWVHHAPAAVAPCAQDEIDVFEVRRMEVLVEPSEAPERLGAQQPAGGRGVIDLERG